MKTMLREHKGKLIVSSLIILLPMVTNSLWWGTWFWLPLLMLILQWAGVFITFYDQKNRNQSRKAMGLVIWLVPVISLFTGALAATVHMGAQAVSVVTLLTFFSMGLIFVLCGNYMPKFRQNRTIGIKIKWALEDEENWNATHRFSGKVWVIGGLLCMACALIPDPAFAFIPFLLIVVIVAILPCGYSYWFYRQQLKNGVIKKNTAPSSNRCEYTGNHTGDCGLFWMDTFYRQHGNSIWGYLLYDGDRQLGRFDHCVSRY